MNYNLNFQEMPSGKFWVNPFLRYCRNQVAFSGLKKRSFSFTTILSWFCFLRYFFNRNGRVPKFCELSLTVLRHVLAKIKIISELYDWLKTAWKGGLKWNPEQSHQKDFFRHYLVSQAVELGLWCCTQYVLWLLIKSYKFGNLAINC